MSEIISAMRDQLLRLVRTRRLRLLTLLFAAAATTGAFVYVHRVIQELPVAVLDLDNSRLSRALRLAIDATPELRVVGEAPTSLEQAQAMLTRGDIVAAVVIPSGLSASFKRGRRDEVLAAVDMSNVLLGKTASAALTRTTTTLSGGVELTWLRKLGERTTTARARIQPLAVDETLALNPAASYSVYVAPALAFFFFHVFLTILAASPFLPPDPARSLRALVGRELGVLVIGLAVALGVAYGLLPAAGLTPQTAFPLVAAVLLAYCLCTVLLVAAFQAVLPSRMLAFQGALLVAMLSLMLAGATYPIDAFPAPLQRLAAALPFTPFARALRLVLTDRAGASLFGAVFEAFALQASAYVALIVVGLLARRAIRWATSGASPRAAPTGGR